MQYPLKEKIGPPDLLVGRKQEFTNFNKWLNNIPREISKSRVILARRKSGKTSFVQRVFNQLWSQNGAVIPFYLDIADKNIWLHSFAINYYRAFASQYISFIERKPELIRSPLSIEEIQAYGVENEHTEIIRDTKFILANQDGLHQDTVWEIASTAPHRYAAVYDLRFLVILDEFQNLAFHVYPDREFKTKPMDSMPGSFHSLSESKVAPMLVTGSYIGILMRIMDDYLEAGRLSIIRFAPYLDPNEGLEAVYKYAEVYEEPITNQTAQQINELCLSDPYFISCVVESNFSGRDLTTKEGVINTVNYEISARDSQLSKTWAEYLNLTFNRVNGINTKNLMLFLNKHDERYWTPKELKSQLNLDLTTEEIYKRLVLLAESDVIMRGVADIDFRGLQDGTLDLILRHRFKKEIDGFEPDLRTEFQERLAELARDRNKWRGRAGYLEGILTERLMATELRSRKHLRLSDYFSLPAALQEDDAEMYLIDVQERVPFQHRDGTNQEIDIIAKAQDGRVLMIEVRNRGQRTGLKAVTELRTNADEFAAQFNVHVIAAYLSLGGFTDEAQVYCEANGLATATEIRYQ